MVIKGVESGFGITPAFPSTQPGKTKPQPVKEDFGKVIGDMVDKVNSLQQESDKAIQGLATGESRNLHEAIIAMEKSSISFQFLTQVRNKALEAYQEVMRMQV